MTTPRHEAWQNEPQGNAIERRKASINHNPYGSEIYYAPHSWEEIDRTAENELTERFMRERIERDIINQQGEENLCSMS